MASISSLLFNSGSASANAEYTNQYDILDNHIKSKKINTIQVKTSDGSTLYIAFKRNFISSDGETQFNNILKNIRYKSLDRSMRCQTCIMGFMKNYTCMVFDNDETLLDGVSRMHPDLVLLNEANGLFNSISGKYVVIDGTIGTKFEGGFPHLHVELPNCDLKNFTVANFNWFINQHFNTLYRLMYENNNDGIIPSLELLLSLLPKVKYGDRIQKSTEWFLRFMKDFRGVDTQRERDIVILTALLNQYMVKGYGEEQIVATNLKQTKDTVLKAMSCAHSESALVNLLTKLFNPDNYMRPTAAPKAGSLKVAMSIFQNANFSTTVMTIDNLLKKYKGKAPPPFVMEPPPVDALSTWGTMYNSQTASNTKGKRGGAGGFAQRAAPKVFIIPKSISELYNSLEKFPGLMVYVNSSSSPVMLTEYPDTSKELLKYDFLWSFKNNSNPLLSYGITEGYHEITAMTSPGTMGRNVFFGISGAYIRDKSPGNTCYPEFLKESVQRKARSAFESLNSNTQAKIPQGIASLALGVGTSRTNSENDLFRSMRFKIKGHTFSISKWE